MIVVFGISAYPTPADAAVIFQVEFRQCNRLHVGYENFPAGTVVRWSVSQHGRGVATGHFVTRAGAGYHFLSARLRPFLQPKPKASVTFAAVINGRQFRTTAGRTTSDPRLHDCVTRRSVHSNGNPSIRLLKKAPAPTPPTTTSVADPPPPVRELAFTGSRPTALLGVGFLLVGAALWPLARLAPARRKKPHLRRPAPWLYVTPAPK
jgi:hypothetical protein